MQSILRRTPALTMLLAALAPFQPAHAGGTLPRVSTVVVVILENRADQRVIGSSQAPYINGPLLARAALLTDSHAVTHPSEPNYLALFSGSTQGLTDDSCPHAYASANLASALAAAGKTFAGYSESMPRDGYMGCSTNLYARKHNPWSDFPAVPARSNLVYRGFPAHPPAVAFIVPNICNDMHDCSTRVGDEWLKANLPPVIAWSAAHNGLLIVTWDEAEPDFFGSNRIPTLVIGPSVVPGKYAQKVDHYSILHTIEKMMGAPCTAAACDAPVLNGMWR